MKKNINSLFRKSSISLAVGALMLTGLACGSTAIQSTGDLLTAPEALSVQAVLAAPAAESPKPLSDSVPATPIPTENPEDVFLECAPIYEVPAFTEAEPREGTLFEEDGSEFSNKTIIIYFNEAKNDEAAEEFCRTHNLTLVYNYNIISGIAASLDHPATSCEEMNQILQNLEKVEEVLFAEKDYICYTNSSIGLSSDFK